MAAKRLYGYRSLLNEEGHESCAAIVAELRRSEYGWETVFAISDCSKQINLSLCDPENASDEVFYNSMVKLWHIQHACKELEKGMRQVRRRAQRAS